MAQNEDDLEEIKRKIDKIRGLVSTSPQTGFIYRALSTSRDTLRNEVSPGVAQLANEIAALKDRIHLIEENTQKILALLEKS